MRHSLLRAKMVAFEVLAEDPPPEGFIWGELITFDDSGKAVPMAVGKVMPTKVAAPRMEASSKVSVNSWYDSGIRLAPPVTSWHDGGLRLEAPPSAPASTPSAHASGTRAVDIEELYIGRRIGKGTQSEVRLGELPGKAGRVALKVGLKPASIAIAREAAVLPVMAGRPGFPTLLHYEVDGPDTPGGALVLELLGPSLDDLKRSGNGSPSETAFTGRTLLRIGSDVVRLLRQLHLAGFVHNDVKPANLLLDVHSTSLQPSSTLHLIDFGSCTRAPGRGVAKGVETDGKEDALRRDPANKGPIGTLMFASVAADECDEYVCETRAADDIESLTYVLTYLASGRLPWQDQSASLAASTKKELLMGSGAATALTAGIECEMAVAAIHALYAEVRRCRSRDRGVELDYEACLAALGGVEPDDAQAD